METYLKKIKHILPTFFIVVFGTIVGISILRWILCIQFSLLDIKEEIWTLWLPLIFPWIPITIWLRPRFRILTFKKETDNRRFLFQFISWGIMTAMLFISQAYLTTATGKLEHLTKISEIEKVEKSRFYNLDNFAVAPYFGGTHTDFRTSGKYNQYLNFDVFFVTPILNDTTERIYSTTKYWYGVKYHKQISNKISNEEKEKKYQAFYNECIQKMNNYDFYSLDHFERKPNSDDLQNFLKAIEARTKQKSDDYIVLVPITESYESRNGNKFAWIFGVFGIGVSVLLLLLIWPGFSETEKKKFLSGKKPKHDEVIDMLKFLIPKDQHFITSIILDLNILLFITMVFSGIHLLYPNGQELLEWGANRRLETTNGDWWRLFTSMFLHGGVMHLILNIYGLVLAAIFVEPILGRKNYAILYIVSGLCGSLASIWWYSNTVSVGASGAIFGLYGAILGLLLTDAFPKGGKKGMLTMIGIYVGINLLFGLTGGIDNAAHIGGLLSGGLLGIILYKLDNENKNATQHHV
jgi:rhomboid protease GluP